MLIGHKRSRPQIPPLSVLASWPKPDYEHPQTHGPTASIIVVTTLALAFTAVAIRYRMQWRRNGRFMLDDFLIGLAFIFSCIMSTLCVLVEYEWKFDRHAWDMPYSKAEQLQKLRIANKILNTTGSGVLRFSLYALYWRLIHPVGMRTYNWVMYFGIFLNAAIIVTFLVLTLLSCVPLSYFWEFPRSPGGGHCLDDDVATLSLAVINSTADVIAYSTPIPVIWRLDLPAKQKIGACMLFLCGLVAVAAGGVRLYYIWKTFFGTWDMLWYAYGVWVAGAVELNLGVICACAPLLRKWFESVLAFMERIIHMSFEARRPEMQLPKVPTIVIEPDFDYEQSIQSLHRGPRMNMSSKYSRHPISKISSAHEEEWETQLQATRRERLRDKPCFHVVECTSDGRGFLPPDDRRRHEIWKHEEFELTISRVSMD